ncbi:hypothetical protein [Stutzerimonas stutzeri]|uniref:hypothetical protein n=1 Tax=Stutzerimonas stutzeri TaxID=316 RepID=UPI0021AE201B|nr:hypothetical protein [Stutzerimonas stutzeri]
MRNGVLGPGIVGLQCHRFTAQALGKAVVAAFLEAERVQPEQGVVARHFQRPVRQHAGDAVAQHAGVAGEEVDLVAGLQGEQVVGVVDAEVFQRAAGGVPAAIHEQPQGVQVTGFPLVVWQGQGAVTRGPGLREGSRFRA